MLTTHYMDEADALCDRLAIIDHGRIIAQGTPAELKSSIPGGYLLRLRFERVTEELLAELKALPGVTEVRAPDQTSRGRLRRPRRPADRADRQRRAGRGLRTPRRAHRRAQSGDPVSAPHRKEPARLNWKTFFALLARDAHVAAPQSASHAAAESAAAAVVHLRLRQVMTTSGMMPAAYKSMLLPGIMAISMVMAGVQAVAMPLIAEFQFTREIEDRLLAPIETGWLAVEKIVAGMIQALVAGLVVIPAAWLMMGSGRRHLDFGKPLEFLGW